MPLANIWTDYGLHFFMLLPSWGLKSSPCSTREVVIHFIVFVDFLLSQHWCYLCHISTFPFILPIKEHGINKI